MGLPRAFSDRLEGRRLVSWLKPRLIPAAAAGTAGQAGLTDGPEVFTTGDQSGEAPVLPYAGAEARPLMNGTQSSRENTAAADRRYSYKLSVEVKYL